MLVARLVMKAVWSIVGLLLLVAGTAKADPNNLNNRLRGDYAFSGTTTCLVSRGGFNANLTPVGPPAPFPFVISFGVQGVRTFNGDGTGTVTARVVSLSHPFALPTSPTPFFSRGGAGSSDIESTFTYEVAPDRTFTIETVTVTGAVLTGGGAGQTFTITDLPVFSGLISKDHRTLTVNHNEPGVETITFSGGDVQQRICHRARILLELRGEK